MSARGSVHALLALSVAAMLSVAGTTVSRGARRDWGRTL